VNILDEALALVEGERQRAYGDPKLKYEQIAGVWSVLFKTYISPEQVVIAMCAIKLIRASNRDSVNRDDLIDLCGYALILSRIAEKPNEQQSP